MSEIWNLSTICRCCHSDGNFRSLREPYAVGDDIEIYESMLKDVFSIAILTTTMFEASYAICEECIQKLKNAVRFKQQVLECEEKFNLYCRNELFIPPQIIEGVVKTEPTDSTKDEFDNELFILPHIIEDVVQTEPIVSTKDEFDKEYIITHVYPEGVGSGALRCAHTLPKDFGPNVIEGEPISEEDYTNIIEDEEKIDANLKNDKIADDYKLIQIKSTDSKVPVYACNTFPREIPPLIYYNAQATQSTSIGQSAAKPPKTKAEYQKAYREREKAKKNENKQESSAKPPKTKAEYQKEYRERQKAKKKKNKQERSAIPPKTKAEYQKEYRERQKARVNENKQESTAKRPKTNAEHQKAFRERRKINNRQSNAALNAPSKTKKTQSEHCKEYQQKSRLKRHRVQLDALLFEKSEAPQSTQQSSQWSQNIIIETGHYQHQLNTRHTINVIVNNKKTERQKRYREQNREKLKQCKAERRKRIKHSQSIAIPSTSSNTDTLEVDNEEKSIAGPSTSSNTNILEVNNEEIINALRKKREYQRKYRERNRDKLKQREAERRRRLQNKAVRRKRKRHSQIIAGPSTSNTNTLEINNEEKSIAGPATSSNTNTLEVNNEKILNAHQKKREYQRRYREQNRDKLNQLKAERRRRLKMQK